MPGLTRQYADHSRPIETFSFVVDVLEAGQRIDAVLRSHYPWHSRTFYRNKLRRGEVLVGGSPAKPSTRLRKGDTVVVMLPPDPEAPEQEADDLLVLYEDEDIVVVDKPSGIACHPVGRTRHGTVINKLHARYRRQGDAEDVVPRLGHRLDLDTSGVLLCVKHAEADRRVTEIFTAREAQKTYLAIVEGCPAQRRGEVVAPLGPDPTASTRLHQAVLSDGLPSRSTYEVREQGGGVAYVALSPHTGRTHQLRVHMQFLGHPILCDHLYGDVRPRFSPDEPDHCVLERLALHAYRLEMPHPIQGIPLVIRSPLPADMRACLAAHGMAVDR